MLYGECSLNPLTFDELQLAEEEMRAFKIPLAMEIAEKRKSRAKKLKMGDTSAIDCSTGSIVVVSSLTKSSPKTMPSWKRGIEEEGDKIEDPLFCLFIL